MHASATAGYYRNTENHQLDLVFEKELFGINNKLLAGINYNKYEQSITPISPGSSRSGVKFLARPTRSPTPGWSQERRRTSPVRAAKCRSTRSSVTATATSSWSRTCSTNGDPGFEINPSIAIHEVGDRAVLDQYKPKTDAWYVNYQAARLDDRLTVLAGYRKEKSARVTVSS
ncbi:MAG: hypothetical protein R3F03_01920 [Opitutaceae bacterium]